MCEATDLNACPKCGAPLTGKREAACGTKWSGSGNIVQSGACVYVLRFTTEANQIIADAKAITDAATSEANQIIADAKSVAEKVYPEMVEMVRSDFRAKIAEVLKAPESV